MIQIDQAVKRVKMYMPRQGPVENRLYSLKYENMFGDPN